MHYDFLNFSDILFVFALGLIIGMPLGWIVIRHSAELTAYLRYHLKVKRAFRPLGPLCGFKGQNWYQSAKSPTPEQNATDQAAEPQHAPCQALDSVHDSLRFLHHICL